MDDGYGVWVVELRGARVDMDGVVLKQRSGGGLWCVAGKLRYTLPGQESIE